MVDEVFRSRLIGLLTTWKNRNLVLGFSSSLCTVFGPCSLTAMSATEIQFSLDGPRGVAAEVIISLQEITKISVAPYEPVARAILQELREHAEEDAGMFRNDSVKEVADVCFEDNARLLIGVVRENDEGIGSTAARRCAFR